jgi:hypothetical protein
MVFNRQKNLIIIYIIVFCTIFNILNVFNMGDIEHIEE